LLRDAIHIGDDKRIGSYRFAAVAVYAALVALLSRTQPA